MTHHTTNVPARPHTRAVAVVLGIGLVAALVLVGAPAQATFPGRNGLIAFTRGGNLFTSSASGGSVTQLTTSGGLSGAKWSPSGTRLAYRNAAGSVYVRTMSTGRTVRVGTGAHGPVAWTRDGARVAFIADPHPGLSCSNGQPLVDAGVYTAPADASTSPRLLYGFHDHGYTDCDVTVESLSLGGFSMDGHLLSFTLCSSFGSAGSIDCGMWTDDPSGVYPGNLIVGIACHDATFVAPCTALSGAAYGPGGNGVLFSGKGDDLPGSSDTAAQRVFAVDKDGTGLHRVSTAASGTNPTWSPRGDIVLFTRRSGTTTSILKVTGTSAAATPTVLLANATQPDWQPVP